MFLEGGGLVSIPFFTRQVVGRCRNFYQSLPEDGVVVVVVLL